MSPDASPSPNAPSTDARIGRGASARGPNNDGGLRAIIFEWDSTVGRSVERISSAFSEVSARLLGEAFPTTEAEHALLVQLGEQQAFQLLTDDPTTLVRLLDTFRHTYAELMEQDPPVDIDAVRDLLAAIAISGVPIGILSTGDRGRLELEAERYGIGSHVTYLFTGESVQTRAPNPLALQSLLLTMEADPQDTIHVAGTVNELIAGRAAGLHTILLQDGGAAAEAASEDPDEIIRSLAALADRLLLVLPDPSDASSSR